MRRSQSGQALVEWAAVAFVLLLFALGLVAIGQIVGEYMAVRSAASQAAFAAMQSPSVRTPLAKRSGAVSWSRSPCKSTSGGLNGEAP